MDQNTAASTIDRVESRLGQLHKDALLSDQRNQIGEIDAQLIQLPFRLAQLRSQGYAYKSHLEVQVAQLAERWPSIRSQVSIALDTQSAGLRSEINRADQAVRRLQPLKAQPLSAVQSTIKSVEDTLSAVERRIRAAQQAVEAIFGPVAADIRNLALEVQLCERMFEWLAGATFVLDPGEGLVAATEASWIEGKDQTRGILYLTDRRMLFERREKVARKKILFITTASETVRELRWQVALADIERVDAGESRRMLISKREILTVTPRSGERVEFHLDMDSDTWRAGVLRCQSGEIVAERVENLPDVPEYLIPAKCSSCGGSMRQAGRIRGISSVQCEYCGATIALERA